MAVDWTHLSEELGRRDAEGLLRRARTISPLPCGRCGIDEREFVNFASNDYLGLAGDARLIAAAMQAVHEHGTGARASAAVCGRTVWHAELEEVLSHFEQTEAALLFPSGYAANVGTITALVGPDDVVFCDRWNHASLVDGCRLSGAALKVYRHDRLDDLERRLQKSRATTTARIWLVTDSVFSMDGDTAPLSDLVQLAKRFEARLIVDEAHGTGVFGDGGRGVAEAQGVEDDIDVRIGTLSKSLGSLGGFVVGPQVLIDYLRNTARPQIYSTALPPAACAAARAAVDIVQSEPERRTQLHEKCHHLREQLQCAPLPPLKNSAGPIIPLIVGDAARTVALGATLERSGFLVGAIRPPTVPRGTARLRVTVSAAHTNDDLTTLATAIVNETTG